MKINLGLDNEVLYEGCEVQSVGGRLTLVTPPQEAAFYVGRNVENLIKEEKDRSEVILSGPMAIWAYLVVFHSVVHRFGKVFYEDGQGREILVAMH